MQGAAVPAGAVHRAGVGASSNGSVCPLGRVAFAGDDGMLWVANPDGTGRRRISTISALSPTWSPDGRQLAFRHIGPDGSELYVVGADGGNERRIGEGTSNWSPAWSPDGSKIAYSSLRNGEQEIVTMTPDGRLLADLTSGQEGEYPAWSPDGSRIAFASARGRNYDIWVMNADGSAMRDLSRHPAYDMYPAWSPDGQKIAFGSDRTRPNPSDFVEQDVFVMNTDGSNVRNVTRTRAVAEGFPSWRADGALTYVRGNDTAHPPTFWSSDANGDRARSLGFGGQFAAWEPRAALGCNPRTPPERLAFVRSGSDDNFDVFVGDTKSTQVADITNSPQTESFPRWSPGGDRLLFIRGDRVGHGTIVVVAADGSRPEEVVPSLDDVRSATWSPDGRRIAFSVFGGSGHVYVVNSDGSGVHPLASTSASDSPAWSPNGRFIAFRREYPANDEIVRVRVATGALRRLTYTRSGRNDLTPAWSPDGTKIAYSSDEAGRSSIWIMNSDGSDTQQFTRAGDGVGFPAWSEDGSTLVYENHGALWRARADGARPQLVLEDAHFPSISPTGAEREASLLRISARAHPGAHALTITGSLAAGNSTLAHARVVLHRSGKAHFNVHSATDGAGRFRTVVHTRHVAGTSLPRVIAFFAGDSTTLANVTFAKCSRG